MGQLLRRLAAFLGLISPKRYAYPALDITLPGDRRLHLVVSNANRLLRFKPRK